jgi:Na+/H+ antiporter NhaD/arsenite permease-like protein
MHMSKTGLRLRLLGLWALSLVACVAVGLLLGQLYLQSTKARVGRAESVIAHACDLIRDRTRAYEGAWRGAAPGLSDPKFRADLQTAVNLALTGQSGVEGGVWQAEAGPLAYAFPTYPGTGPKTDLPTAERDHIQAVNDQAAREERPIGRRSVARGQNLLLYACALTGQIPRLTAWTMTRVESVPEYDRLRVGLAVLLGFMVLMAAWLARVLILWARYMSIIEAAPGTAGAGAMPTLPPSGAREISGAVEARREASSRLAEARQQTAALAARATRVELLAIVILGVIMALALSAAVATLTSPGSVLGSDTVRLAAVAIFAGAYLALALGKIPGLRIDRAGVALVGASLMVGAGVLTLDEAYKAVDFGTITLLLGIMIVVANLRLSGFFTLANAWVAHQVRRPIGLLAAVTIVSGLFSAFLVNDAICLVLTPLVLDLTLSLKRRPAPYLLAVAMASNIGSTATITGNPQNIMIGSFSHLPYLRFALALAPVAIIGLALTILLLASVYRSEFAGGDRLSSPPHPVRVRRALMARALFATGIMVALFFAGQPPAKAAIVIGGLLLLTRRLKSERVYAEIDWSLLLMFVGLFVIVAGAEHALLTPDVLALASLLHLDQVPALSLVTALLSNLVSNVPAVLVLRPFVDALHDRDTAWLVVAMASTLAGNFTVLGSIANLIVVQKAASRGVSIGFWDYSKVGLPLTLITLGVGTMWLTCR